MEVNLKLHLKMLSLCLIWINIFSINKALINGFMIGKEGMLIKLTKGETMIALDERLNNKGGLCMVSRLYSF
jgi:hypothetical protein